MTGNSSESLWANGSFAVPQRIAFAQGTGMSAGKHATGRAQSDTRITRIAAM